MSKVIPINPEQRRFDEASTWVARLDKGLSQQQTEALHQWLSEDPANRDLLLKMTRLWDKMDALEKLRDLFPEAPSSQPKSSVKGWAIAATFVIASFTGLMAWQYGDVAQQPVQQVVSANTYSTQVGEQATFYLQDNTKVVLNTNSKVKVTYTNLQRAFELVQGEMHITVAHNSQQPLSVYAAGQVIQAVGTAFNVQLQAQQVELIVTEGKVLVAKQDPAVIDPIALSRVALPVSSLALVEGEKVNLDQSSARQVEKISAMDLQANLSWQQGDLIFRGESLEQAMQEVSRYSDYSFVFEDESLRQVQIAGLFKTNDINGLLKSLKQNFDIDYQRTSPDTVLLTKVQPH